MFQHVCAQHNIEMVVGKGNFCRTSPYRNNVWVRRCSSPICALSLSAEEIRITTRDLAIEKGCDASNSSTNFQHCSGMCSNKSHEWIIPQLHVRLPHGIT